MKRIKKIILRIICFAIYKVYILWSPDGDILLEYLFI